MRYAAILDYGDIEFPVIGILDKASDTEVSQNSANDDVLDTIQLLLQRSIVKWAYLVLDNDGVRLLSAEFRDKLSLRSECIEGIRFPMFGSDNLVPSRPAVIDEIFHFPYRFLDIANIIFAFWINPLLLEIYEHQRCLCHYYLYKKIKS